MQIFQKVKTGGVSICVSCVHRKVCKGIDNQPCVECNQFLNEDKKPQTNADRIRAMSDEELAWELMTWRIETEAKHQGIESNCPNTQSTILEWLKQPAEEVSESGA